MHNYVEETIEKDCYKLQRAGVFFLTLFVFNLLNNYNDRPHRHPIILYRATGWPS